MGRSGTAYCKAVMRPAPEHKQRMRLELGGSDQVGNEDFSTVCWPYKTKMHLADFRPCTDGRKRKNHTGTERSKLGECSERGFTVEWKEMVAWSSPAPRCEPLPPPPEVDRLPAAPQLQWRAQPTGACFPASQEGNTPPVGDNTVSSSACPKRRCLVLERREYPVHFQAATALAELALSKARAEVAAQALRAVETSCHARWESGEDVQKLREEVADQGLTITTCRASLKRLREELGRYKDAMQDAIGPLRRTAERIRLLKERCATSEMYASLADDREEALARWLGETQASSRAEMCCLVDAKRILWNAIEEEVPWAPPTGFATGLLGKIAVGARKEWMTMVQEEGQLTDQRHGLLVLVSTGVNTVVSGSQRPGAGPNVGHPLGGVRGPVWSECHAERFIAWLANLGYRTVITVDEFAADAIRGHVAALGMAAPVAPYLHDFTTPALADFIGIMGLTHALAVEGAPINVHCAGGTGRTGLLLMGLGILERWWQSPSAFALGPVERTQEVVQAVVSSYSPNAGEFRVATCGEGNKQLLVDFTMMAAEETDAVLGDCPQHYQMMALLSRMLQREVQRHGETPTLFPIGAALRVCACSTIHAACCTAAEELKRLTGAIYCALVLVDHGELVAPQDGAAASEWKRKSIESDNTFLGEVARTGLPVNAAGTGICHGSACVPIGRVALAQLVNGAADEFDTDTMAAVSAFATVVAPTLGQLFAHAA